MKLWTVLLLVISLFCCCKDDKTPAEAFFSDSTYLQKKARLDSANAKTLLSDSLVQTIEFKVQATKEELDISDDGIIPYISLEKPSQELRRLQQADQIVLHDTAVEVTIDYPLNKPFTFQLSSKKGFSRRQLILAISKKYHELYAEEESSATVKTIPADKREGLINRNETNGKHGIWGHDLSDLDLSSILVYKKADGKIRLELSVES